MSAGRIRFWPVLMVCLTGCPDCSDRERRDLNRRRDALVQQRAVLAIHQANTQIAIRQGLGGRPPEALTRAEVEQVRASPLGQQLAFIDWQITTVDREIESVQQELWDLDRDNDSYP